MLFHSLNTKKYIDNTYTAIGTTCLSSWGKSHKTNSDGSNKEKDLHDDFLQVKSKK